GLTAPTAVHVPLDHPHQVGAGIGGGIVGQARPPVGVVYVQGKDTVLGVPEGAALLDEQPRIGGGVGGVHRHAQDIDGVENGYMAILVGVRRDHLVGGQFRAVGVGVDAHH